MSQSVDLLLRDPSIRGDFLQQLEEAYQLKINSCKPVRSVLELSTNRGRYALKAVSYREARLKYIISAMEHLYQKGFTDLARIVPSRSGEYALRHGEFWYFLSEWIEGKQCDSDNPQHLALATETLAIFHANAQGLIPPAGTHFKVMWDRWPELLTRRTSSFGDYFQQAGQKHNRFCRIWLKHFAYYLNQAKQALHRLEVSQYPLVAEQAKKNQTFVHRDVAARNFIITPTQKAYMIDFDYCRFDIRLTDIQRLLERTLKGWEWDFDMAVFLLGKYHSFYPLQDYELPVLWAMMTFPQKFWRLSERYFERRRDWSESKFIERLEDLIASQRKRDLFLQRYERRFCRAGGVFIAS